MCIVFLEIHLFCFLESLQIWAIYHNLIDNKAV